MLSRMYKEGTFLRRRQKSTADIMRHEKNVATSWNQKIWLCPGLRTSARVGHVKPHIMSGPCNVFLRINVVKALFSHHIGVTVRYMRTEPIRWSTILGSRRIWYLQQCCYHNANTFSTQYDSTDVSRADQSCANSADILVSSRAIVDGARLATLRTSLVK